MKMNDRTVSRPRTCARRAAFTLIELLIVIAIIAILAAILLPVLDKAEQRAQGIQCLGSLKQLQVAWLMYADDNADRITQNLADNTGGFTDTPTTLGAQPGQPYASWVLGSVSSSDTLGLTNIQSIMHGLLFSYVNNVKTYKCPAD